jgi:HAD superfamily hydrolase (TIGR01509 family)
MNPSRPRAVLWDLDGTLLDSAAYHRRAWRETMTAVGRPISEADFAATFGLRNDTILRHWLGPDLPSARSDEIAEAKERRYRELVRTEGVVLLPGVAAWLARLRDGGWRQALATSAPQVNVAAILAALGIAAFFAAIVQAEDVSAGKPDPQVYLLAAARAGVTAPRCIVVEDAAAGIEGARRAGMRSIGVGPGHAALAADLRVRSLDLLPADAFETLLAAPVSPP